MIKGSKCSNKAKEKMRLAKLKNPVRYWLGKKMTESMKRKMSLAKLGKIPWNKGKHLSEKAKQQVRNSIKKLWQNTEYRKRMMRIHLERKKGKNELHYNWRGGKSFEPYSPQFNEELKSQIKQKDNFTCQLCKVEEKDYFQKLSIHHIDYDKKNCEENNLITLCRGCNAKANYNRSYWQKYFTNIVAAETKRSDTKADR